MDSCLTNLHHCIWPFMWWRSQERLDLTLQSKRATCYFGAENLVVACFGKLRTHVLACVHIAAESWIAIHRHWMAHKMLRYFLFMQDAIWVHLLLKKAIFIRLLFTRHSKTVAIPPRKRVYYSCGVHAAVQTLFAIDCTSECGCWCVGW